MRSARIHLIHGLGAFLLAAPFLACAIGAQSPDVGPGPVTPQTETNDASITLDDAATAPTGTTTDPPPPSGDDAAAPPPAASDDAGTPPPSPTSHDAGSAVDSAPPPPVVDDAGSGPAPSCPGYAAPGTSAACTCTPSSSHTCDVNGCYNGYYCKLATDKCQTKPAGC